jgi:hypothetical protein
VNRKLLWMINTLMLIILVVSVTISYRHLNPSQTLMMSCSSELFDRNEPRENVSRHYLLVDVFAKGKLAQLNYRYFNHDGSSAGNIRMKGNVLDVNADTQKYSFSVKTKEESGLDSEIKPPEHMRYLSYVSSFNLDKKGMHNLSVEMLDFNQQNDYAVVIFQPSNTVCGCRLVQ